MKISMNGAGDPAILYLPTDLALLWLTARTYETLTNVRRVVPAVDQVRELAVADLES